MNSYELNAKRMALKDSLSKAEHHIIDLASDPNADKEQIETAQKHRDDLKAKFEAINAAYKKTASEEIKAATPVNKPKAEVVMTPEQKKETIVAAWIRKTMKPEDAAVLEKWHSIKDELKDDSDVTKGADVLPVNVASDLVYEPLATNPLRSMEEVSTVTNLVLPTIAFEVVTDAVKDGDPAKDAAVTGGEIEFGRFKTKVRAGISETILNGTDANLVGYVNNALSSALQARELSAALSTSPATGEEHMSFYNAVNGIKTVNGTDMFKAINKALADLDDAYQDNAQVLMTRADYFDMLDQLSNSSATLYEKQPEQIFGVPVHFTSKATTPIVGDFHQARLNYDIATPVFEQYKDYKTGFNYFQLTAWLDHRIKLASAFRLASVGASAGK
ncbi:phage major capsid protein [Lactobacillus delbrueckii subsp. lactis]|jgi:HK97 family phage major capsid protein|uniref:phage major capsid protein n=1 Tax=Lactobacillales TaxID=186826 RepID=UPI0001EC348B|nr:MULTISPECIES: phage major capsid protein [Lactobacillales]ADQ61232.1 Major capsid protein HK97 [Lactobacillus delbrueckii subsp. bulgaricus ND02]MBO3081454.1 phage major capsid protein [Lactobacillus delbrueckii subsp. bulgaricus]MCD5438084.1 phage major capsid protein [Lactobacillus delbrueckii subsp. lactis]MCD5468616.1 phage major capsid protein [Lactobacillus delbrueckii subsp. lactis]MCZ0795601.1 phage major capsid protein [Lactobacillus delbrueckii subsp. lactis]